MFKRLWYGSLGKPWRIIVAAVFKWVRVMPSSKIQKLIAFPGLIKVVLNSGKHFFMQGTGLNLENKIYWGGVFGHEAATISVFMKLVPNVSWIVDVGANTGLFALIAKTVNPNAAVAAFEPMPFFYNLLKKNSDLNKYNILCLQQASSSENGNKNFYVPSFNRGNIYSSTLVKEHFNAHQTTSANEIIVKTRTLESFIEQQGWQGLGLIKIDAEGHDDEVIKGLGKMIFTHCPVMIVEIQSIEKSRQILCLSGIEQYLFYSINDKMNLVSGPLNIPFEKGCDNYLFIPKQESSTLSSCFVSKHAYSS